MVVCSNIQSCQSELTAYGVDWSQNVDFILASSDSFWVRDYGGAEQLPSGVYFVTLQSGDARQVQKVVVKH
ncbi:MAG: T9SS type A sorting domain-containing protein [Saprospiraceae bacterium]|nr:T9SS type A sorting domain-containing protein [Saprospiraceae bacterium]